MTDIYLLRDTLTGQWLTSEGFSDEPTGAFIYLSGAASLPPRQDLEWVKFSSVPF